MNMFIIINMLIFLISEKLHLATAKKQFLYFVVSFPKSITIDSNQYQRRNQQQLLQIKPTQIKNLVCLCGHMQE